MKPPPSVFALAAFAVALAGAVDTAAGTATPLLAASSPRSPTGTPQASRRPRSDSLIDAPELGTGECYSRAARAALIGRCPSEATSALKPTRHSTRPTNPAGYSATSATTVRASTSSWSFAATQPRTSIGRAREVCGCAHGSRSIGEIREARPWASCPKTELDPTEAINTGRSGPARAACCDRDTCDAGPGTLHEQVRSELFGWLCSPYPPDVDSRTFGRSASLRYASWLRPTSARRVPRRVGFE